MSYNYQTEKPFLFTERGQVAFLAIRDNVHKLLSSAGAVRMQEAYRVNSGAGTSWQELACVDRLVELGEIREITQGDVAGQHRVFVSVI